MIFRSGIGKRIRDAWVRQQDRRAYVQELRLATEQVVQVADPGIRNAVRYQKVLHGPIDDAMQYCTKLIDAIPGPVPLSRKGYEADPRVQYLFASAEELEEVLRISPGPQALRTQGYVGEVSALLTMTRSERTVFGYEQEGESIQQDVAHQAVSFVDHRIVAPAETMSQVKRQLVQRGLDILATAAMETITGLKAKKAELREQKEYFSAMLKIMGGKRKAWEPFAPPDSGKIDEIVKLEERLTELETDYAALRKQLDGPEDAMVFLKTVMSRPHEELSFQHYSLRLDWRRFRLDGNDDAEGKEVRLVEMSNRSGEIQRSAVMVTFTLGETTSS